LNIIADYYEILAQTVYFDGKQFQAINESKMCEVERRLE